MPVLAQQQTAQQDDTPLFRAGVALVKVDVQVAGANGRAITGLAQEDFTVADEARPQAISYFGRESEPLDVLLLLDVSGSMTRSLEEMASAARGALAQLHSGDRVAVMLFARQTAIARKFTSDFAAVQSDLRQAAFRKDLGGGSLLNESLIAAAEYLRSEPVRGRRAMVILTDNEPLNYQSPDEDVVRALFAADTVLNGIVLRKGSRPKSPRPGRAVNPDFTPANVFAISGRTGGECLEGKVGESFQQMMERLRSRYGLQYPAPASEAGAFRRIRVELSPQARGKYPQAKVRARAGYYAIAP